MSATEFTGEPVALDVSMVPPPEPEGTGGPPHGAGGTGLGGGVLSVGMMGVGMAATHFRDERDGAEHGYVPQVEHGDTTDGLARLVSGNARLGLGGPPRIADVARWREDFREQFARVPRDGTLTVVWEGDHSFDAVIYRREEPQDLTVTYARDADGHWVPLPGDFPPGARVPDINRILDPSVSDADADPNSGYMVRVPLVSLTEDGNLPVGPDDPATHMDAGTGDASAQHGTGDPSVDHPAASPTHTFTPADATYTAPDGAARADHDGMPDAADMQPAASATPALHDSVPAASVPATTDSHHPAPSSVAGHTAGAGQQADLQSHDKTVSLDAAHSGKTPVADLAAHAYDPSQHYSIPHGDTSAASYSGMGPHDGAAMPAASFTHAYDPGQHFAMPTAAHDQSAPHPGDPVLHAGASPGHTSATHGYDPSHDRNAAPHTAGSHVSPADHNAAPGPHVGGGHGAGHAGDTTHGDGGHGSHASGGASAHSGTGHASVSQHSGGGPSLLHSPLAGGGHHH